MNPAWKEEAACKGLDPDLFHPGKGEACALPMAVCRRCPVRLLCLEANLHEDQGIWGGTTAIERRRIRRARRSAA